MMDQKINIVELPRSHSMSPIFEIFFHGKELVFNSLIPLNDVKIKLRLIMKNIQSIEQYSFHQNQFYDLWSS